MPIRTLVVQLVRAQKLYPGMTQALRLQHDLFRAGARSEPWIPTPPVDHEALMLRLFSGQALIQDSDLERQLEARIGFARKICGVIQEHHPQLGKALDWIRDHLGAICGTVAELEAHGDAVDQITWDEGLVQLARFVRRQSFLPFLHVRAVKLVSLVNGLPVLPSLCPVCGGEPVISALRHPDGDRRLMCGRCLAEWAFRRVGCPFCDSRDPNSFAYHMDEDPGYRLYVCQGCHGYLKTVDERENANRLPLAIEHILTMGMDEAAVEAGYQIRRTGWA